MRHAHGLGNADAAGASVGTVSATGRPPAPSAARFPHVGDPGAITSGR